MIATNKTTHLKNKYFTQIARNLKNFKNKYPAGKSLSMMSGSKYQFSSNEL